MLYQRNIMRLEDIRVPTIHVKYRHNKCDSDKDKISNKFLWKRLETNKT